MCVCVCVCVCLTCVCQCVCVSVCVCMCVCVCVYERERGGGDSNDKRKREGQAEKNKHLPRHTPKHCSGSAQAPRLDPLGQLDQDSPPPPNFHFMYGQCAFGNARVDQREN